MYNLFKFFSQLIPTLPTDGCVHHDLRKGWWWMEDGYIRYEGASFHCIHGWLYAISSTY